MKKMNEDKDIKRARRQRLRDVLHYEVRPRVIGAITGVALGITTCVGPALMCTKSNNKFVVMTAAETITVVPATAEETNGVVTSHTNIANKDRMVIDITATTIPVNKKKTINDKIDTLIINNTIGNVSDSSKDKSDSTTSETTTLSNTTTTTSTTTSTTSTTTTTTVTSETTTTTQTKTREYVVYKPSTHYIHRNTCRWYDSTCVEISSTADVEARRCTECNAEMEILHQYVPPTTTTTTTTTTVPVTTTVVTTAAKNTSGHAALNYITETERIYLCNVVSYEYGADWVSLYDKGLVVACVMNRVRDGGWTYGKPSTIYNVLTAPYQFSPAYAVPYYSPRVTKSVIDAVDYYFEHQDQFPRNIHSYWGDGRLNHFS